MSAAVSMLRRTENGLFRKFGAPVRSVLGLGGHGAFAEANCSPSCRSPKSSCWVVSRSRGTSFESWSLPGSLRTAQSAGTSQLHRSAAFRCPGCSVQLWLSLHQCHRREQDWPRRGFCERLPGVARPYERRTQSTDGWSVNHFVAVSLPVTGRASMRTVLPRALPKRSKRPTDST